MFTSICVFCMRAVHDYWFLAKFAVSSSDRFLRNPDEIVPIDLDRSCDVCGLFCKEVHLLFSAFCWLLRFLLCVFCVMVFPYIRVTKTTQIGKLAAFDSKNTLSESEKLFSGGAVWVQMLSTDETGRASPCWWETPSSFCEFASQRDFVSLHLCTCLSLNYFSFWGYISKECGRGLLGGAVFNYCNLNLFNAFDLAMWSLGRPCKRGI